MIVREIRNVPPPPRKRGLASFLGFGGAVPQLKAWSSYGSSDFQQSTDWGLRKYADFYDLYAAADNIVSQVNAYADDPNFQAFVREVKQAINDLDAKMQVAADNWEYDNRPVVGSWWRSPGRQATLRMAIERVQDILIWFRDQVPGKLGDIREAVAARERAQAAARQADLEAQAKIDAARKAAAELERSKASAAGAQAQATEAQAQYETMKLIKKLEAPRLFGIPLTIVIPVVAAVGIGVTVLIVKRKKS